MNEIDYILNGCIHIDKTKYEKQQKKELIKYIIDLVITLIITILIFTMMYYEDKLEQENTELKQKIQEYQEKVVYYRHTYEDEV